jgi:GcrA cell cycle regulator
MNTVTGCMMSDEPNDEARSAPANDLVVRPCDRWPEWRIDLLKKLFAEGVTITQIALRLGTTRNAIVGKKWRLGLPTRQTTKTTADMAAQMTARKANRARKQRERRRKPGYVAPHRTLPVPTGEIYLAHGAKIPSLDITLHDLQWSGARPANCRAITSTDGAIETLYCGLPVADGESYCLGHCRRFFNRYSPGHIPPGIARVAASYKAG